MTIVYVPAQFQLLLPPERAWAQQIVAGFATEHGVPFIDLCWQCCMPSSRARPESNEPDTVQQVWSRYILDPNRLNERGHRWVADLLVDTTR